MRRIDRIRGLTAEKMAKIIVEYDIDLPYCKGNCGDHDECLHPVECCINWLNADERMCRECGCTDDRACPGGCYWVGADLCSKCAQEIATADE